MSEKQIHNFIPGWYAAALQKKLLLEWARMQGYSDEDIEKLRAKLDEQVREPVLVSLDEIYGEEEE